MLRKGTIIPEYIKTFAKANVTVQKLNYNMNPLKMDKYIYLFIIPNIHNNPHDENN